MDFENELWKEIKGYDGRYQVSNYGRIWNVATQSMMKPQLKKTGSYSGSQRQGRLFNWRFSWL